MPLKPHEDTLHTATSLGVLAAKGQQVPAVTAPVGGEVGETFEAVRNPVVDLLLVWIGLVVRLTDTLGDNLGVAFAVAGVFAVRTLHPRRVFEEVSAQRTAHDVVELLSDELVALLLVDLLLLLPHGTLSIEADVEGTTILELFGYTRH